VQRAIAAKAGIGAGDAVFFAAGDEAKAAALAGKARNRIGDELGLGTKDQFAFCWITDFPQYEWNEDEKRIDFSHNPFSMPAIEPEDFLALDNADKERILSLTAYQYDMVCNGYEMASGAIRNHRPDIMKKAFAIAGYDEGVLEERFGGMYRAFQYGAPPHGGMAAGIDRIVMLLCGAQNLREITMFPMNQRAEDLLLGAPSAVMPKQLRELHIRLNLPEK
jgi:aspartyl-tRNA synthetase